MAIGLDMTERKSNNISTICRDLELPGRQSIGKISLFILPKIGGFFIYL